MRSYDPANFRSKKLPVCLCLDTSGSMNGAAIDSLNEGLGVFWEALREDDEASNAVDIAIISFGCTGVECLMDFGTVNSAEPVKLYAGGMTPLGEAAELTAEMLEARLSAYREAGCEYYSPWLILTTDGMPNGNPARLRQASIYISRLARSERLSIFPVAVGRDADIEALQKFSPSRKVMRLKGFEFAEMLLWFAENLSRAVRMTRTLTSPDRWGELV